MPEEFDTKKKKGSRKELQHKFILIPNTFYIDLIDLNDSQYIKQKLGGKIYLFICMEAARNRCFVCFQNSKTIKDSQSSFDLFKEYILKLPDQKISRIVTDDGNEFKTIFDSYAHRTINAEAHDHLQLAHINRFSRTIRNYVHKRFQKIEADSITDKQFEDILDEIIYNIQLNFYNCEFNTLDFSSSNLNELDSKFFYFNQINNIILSYSLQKLDLCRLQAKQFKSITFMYHYVVSIIIQSSIENIFIENQHTNKRIINFQKFNKLKVLHLDNINQDIMLPDNLENLKLTSKSQQCKVLNKTIYAYDIKLQNFTLSGKIFSEHSKIYLKFCIVDFIITGDFKYIINQNDAKTLIIKEHFSIEQIKDVNKLYLLSKNVQSILYTQKLFLVEPILLNQVDNYTKTQNQLDILGLNNLIIDIKEVCDYSYFQQLKELNLSSITKSVKLPQSLQKLVIFNITELDLDLRDYKNLKIYFKDCQIKKLITINDAIFEKSTVDYYYATTLGKDSIRTKHNTYIYSIKLDTTEIKMLQLDYIENIQEIILFGTNTILTKNNSIEGIIDFTPFASLNTVCLEQVTCNYMKFGAQQKMIKLKNAQIKRIDMDFSLNVNFMLENSKIDVLTTYGKFKLKYSQIRLLKLIPPLANCKIVYFTDNFTGSCQYIAKCNKGFNQRFLYELHKEKDDNFKKNNVKKVFTISHAQILVVKIDFIYQKINELLLQ